MTESAPFDLSENFLTRSLQEHALVILLGLFILLVIQSLRLTWNRGLAARRIARHRQLGKGGESRAIKLLQKSGFQLVAAQAPGSYEMVVDGDLHRVHLRADFLVTHKKRTYVAEVKSGEESVKVTGRATRRQLLEYLYAFDVHGVLLVDMHSRAIRRIEFPSPRSIVS